nr:immunoglobulin heavy chain junction region [Macaca mulatta]MOX40780.1 immunoglobulin heavy chain junction region [Macaca mulatta]
CATVGRGGYYYGLDSW